MKANIDLLVLSHGRQGTLSVSLALALVDQVFCPNYNFTDQSIIAGESEHIFSPQIGRYNYQADYPMNIDLKFALIYHGFTSANCLPGMAHRALEKKMTKNTPGVIFARDPSDNFKSSYKKYLGVFEARKYFGIVKNQAMFDRDAPLTDMEFFAATSYLFDYDQQTDFLKQLTDNVVVKSFLELRSEKFVKTVRDLCSLMGLSDPKNCDSVFNNNVDDIEICGLFSNRNRFVFSNKYTLHIGVFPSNSHELIRGSFETKISSVSGVPNGFDIYVSSPDWFTMPIKLRETIVRGKDGDRVFEKTVTDFEKARKSLGGRRSPDNCKIPEIYKIKWDSFASKYGLE